MQNLKYPWSICSPMRQKQISLFNKKIYTLLKLVTIKCSYFPQLPWQYKEFHV